MFKQLSQRLSEPSSRVRQILAVLAVLLILISSVPVTAVAEPTLDTGTERCYYGPPAGGEPTQEDADIALVNDRSNSMNQEVEPGKTRLDVLKNATTGFVKNAENADNYTAVSFASGATVDQKLTTEKEPVITAIDGLSTSIDTDTADGIIAAEDQLYNSTNATDKATKVMVIATDGESNQEQQARDVAKEARDKGVIIYTIGISEDITSSEDDFLINVSGDEDRYYKNPNVSELKTIYDEIENDIDKAETNRLEINTRHLLKPGDTADYTVVENRDGNRTDVTDNVTISSSNISVLSVNNQENTVTATYQSNTSTWVRLDGSYNGLDGCTNVVVANPTVENLEILPFIWRFGALFLDRGFQIILVSLLLSIAATRISGVYAGLSIYQMGLTCGWLIGWVPIGLAMVSLFSTLFVGFNIAANIDYSVRRD